MIATISDSPIVRGFPDILNENYATDAERADAVRSALQAAPDTESPSGTPWTNLESQ